MGCWYNNLGNFWSETSLLSNCSGESRSLKYTFLQPSSDSLYFSVRECLYLFYSLPSFHFIFPNKWGVFLKCDYGRSTKYPSTTVIASSLEPKRFRTKKYLHIKKLTIWYPATNFSFRFQWSVRVSNWHSLRKSRDYRTQNITNKWNASRSAILEDPQSLLLPLLSALHLIQNIF